MNKLIRGDAVKVARDLPNDVVDLTVTSPPFDGLFALGNFDFDALAEQLWRVTKPGGIVAWNVQDRIVNGSQTCSSCRQQIKFRELGFSVHETLIAYTASSNHPWAVHRYPRVWQHVFILSKGKPKTFNPIRDKENKTAGGPVKWSTRDARTGKKTSGKSPHLRVADHGARTNVWELKVGRHHTTKDDFAFSHPALMPEKLANDLIVTYSNPGELVFEPFAGACTTCKQAVLNYRQYLAVELDRKFFRLAQRRMREAEDEVRRRLDEWLAA